jgi:hypothetical protein
MPNTSNTSVTLVSGVAPRRSNAIGSGRQCRRDLARHGEELTPFLEGEVGGDERAAPLARLDDDGCSAETGDDAIARWESSFFKSARGSARRVREACVTMSL